jgi:hypothetical protein
LADVVKILFMFGANPANWVIKEDTNKWATLALLTVELLLHIMLVVAFVASLPAATILLLHLTPQVATCVTLQLGVVMLELHLTSQIPKTKFCNAK